MTSESNIDRDLFDLFKELLQVSAVGGDEDGKLGDFDSFTLRDRCSEVANILRDLSTPSSSFSWPERPAIPGLALQNRIGAGGQGEVWLALDEEGHTVAVKQLLRPTPAARRRIDREARALQKIDHPNIVRFRGVGEVSDSPYLLMDYVAGSSLDRLIVGAQEDAHLERVLPVCPDDSEQTRTVLGAFAKLADALGSLHDVGLVHGDIKPSNIIVRSEDGEPVLVDFGLVRGQTHEVSISISAGGLGTLDYMSPEQAQGDLNLTPRSDTFSLGVTLFETLTGIRPFEGESATAVREAIRYRSIPSVTSWEHRRFDRKVAAILETATAKSPRDRYPDARALGADLTAYLEGRAIRARVASRVSRARLWVRRNQVASVIMGAAGVALIVVLIAFIAVRKSRDLERESRQKAEILGFGTVLEGLLNDSDALYPPVPTRLDAARNWLRLVAQLEPMRSRLDDEIAKHPPAESTATASLRSLLLHQQIRRLEKHIEDHANETESQIVREGQSVLGVEWHVAALERQLDRCRSELRARMAVRDAYQPGNAERSALLRVRELVRRVWGSGGRVAEIERLVREIDRVERVHAAAMRSWEEAIEAVSSMPKYEGLSLAPLVGLMPLGVDRESGLYEFAHVSSSAEGYEEVSRDEGHGLLQLEEEAGLVFVLVPGGVSPGLDGAPEGVSLTPFLISKYEMNQAQWMRLSGGENPSWPMLEEWDPLMPVNRMTWRNAMKVLARYRMELPSEAQWRYACLGGVPGGRDLVRYARFGESRPISPIPVGSLGANRFGLHDTLGNVREWTCDQGRRGVPRAGDGYRPDSGEAGSRFLMGGDYSSERNKLGTRICLEETDSSLPNGVRPWIRITW